MLSDQSRIGPVLLPCITFPLTQTLSGLVTHSLPTNVFVGKECVMSPPLERLRHIVAKERMHLIARERSENASFRRVVSTLISVLLVSYFGPERFVHLSRHPHNP